MVEASEVVTASVAARTSALHKLAALTASLAGLESNEGLSSHLRAAIEAFPTQLTELSAAHARYVVFAFYLPPVTPPRPPTFSRNSLAT